MRLISESRTSTYVADTCGSNPQITAVLTLNLSTLPYVRWKDIGSGVVYEIQTSSLAYILFFLRAGPNYRKAMVDGIPTNMAMNARRLLSQPWPRLSYLEVISFLIRIHTISKP